MKPANYHVLLRILETMPEEFGGAIDTGPSISAGAENAESVSEADISRVEQQTAKAKQIGGYIAQSKKQNNMIADFLMMIIQNISDEILMSKFHKVFFRKTDAKTGQTYIRKNTNNMVMVGLFVPFFQTEAEQMGLRHYFDQIFAFGTESTITSYMNYIKRLSYHHHDNVPLEKADLLELIIQIILYFNLIQYSSLDEEEKYGQFMENLQSELFEQQGPPPALDTTRAIAEPTTDHGKHGHHRDPYGPPANQG